MAIAAADKYYLKSIHEEIALFDRKLAHLAKYEKFDSDEERDLAARKMTTKRNGLVTTAKRLVAEGVEFNASELPRSLRPEGAPIEAAATSIIQEDAPVETPVTKASAPAHNASPYAGTALDWQASVNRYLAKKKRA
jgi:hypothetical protein